jgi:hypothetical protein
MMGDAKTNASAPVPWQLRLQPNSDPMYVEASSIEKAAFFVVTKDSYTMHIKSV